MLYNCDAKYSFTFTLVNISKVIQQNPKSQKHGLWFANCLLLFILESGGFALTNC